MVEKIALRLLSMKSRSIEELRKKLTERGFASEEVEPVLAKMVALGYLNDQETADRRFQNLIRRGYGPRYVAVKLKEQGLKMPPYSEALQREVATAVLKTASFKRRDSMHKKGSALARRGFDIDVIYAVIGS